MMIENLTKAYDDLQEIYGDKNLDSISFGGCLHHPDICFVFMNPTRRNIASQKSWQGMKSPWIGTKNIWTLFFRLGLLDQEIYHQIRTLSGPSWTPSFSEEVYQNVEKHRYYITNLAKCTQVDARSLPDSVYQAYLDLFFKEISLISPKVVFLFGNQVSSIVLGEKIHVSKTRGKCFVREIENKTYRFYPVYYPIGNGIFHIEEAIEDILAIIDLEIKSNH